MEKENSIYGEDRRLGYSQEEDYFNRINRITVARLKAQLSCPKCKGKATAILRDGVILNQCIRCHNEFQDPDATH